MADLARKQRVDTTLLATRADLVALLRGDDDARLLHGWRAELVGDGIQRLVQGKRRPHVRRRGGLRLIDVAADDPAVVDQLRAALRSFAHSLSKRR